MEDLGTASVPALIQYIKSAESHGLNIDQALSLAQIEQAILEDTSQRISGKALEQFLATVIPQTKDPLFGLHTSKFIQHSSYSVLGYIVMNSKTVGDAMNRISLYEKLVGDMGVTKTRKHGDLTLVQWCCKYDHPIVRRHVIENVLSSWVTYTRWMADRADESPVEVWLEHDLPPSQDNVCSKQQLEAEYQSVFRCPIRFNQRLFNKPISAVVVNNDMLNLKVKQADTALLKTLEQHANSLLAEIQPTPAGTSNPQTPHNFTDQVRRILEMQLASNASGCLNPLRKEAIAETLEINGRTLQRRLQQEGTSYQQILDELRKKIAQQQLTDTEHSIPEIAHLLGFTEARSFHRSFKSWTGVTPGEYRRQHQKH